MYLSIFSILFLISHFIFSWMTENQVGVSAVLGIVLGIISADKFNDKNSLEESVNDYLSEYNLAKHELQNQVLELEKVLAQHTKDINTLRLNNVMNFSENFKKKEKQNAYL